MTMYSDEELIDLRDQLNRARLKHIDHHNQEPTENGLALYQCPASRYPSTPCHYYETHVAWLHDVLLHEMTYGLPR